MIIYIGEILRYLYSQPETAEERKHNVRLCYGNGLRADLFEKFQKRFKIKDIMEFYGSTEGNVGFLNANNVPGSCGQIPWLLSGLLNVKLVKYDIEKEEHLKDPKTGKLIECKPGEIGEAIGFIETDQFVNLLSLLVDKF